MRDPSCCGNHAGKPQDPLSFNRIPTRKESLDARRGAGKRPGDDPGSPDRSW